MKQTLTVAIMSILWALTFGVTWSFNLTLADPLRAGSPTYYGIGGGRCNMMNILKHLIGNDQFQLDIRVINSSIFNSVFVNPSLIPLATHLSSSLSSAYLSSDGILLR
jgi:hypothetical protein